MYRSDIKSDLKVRFKNNIYTTYKETKEQWIERMENNINLILNTDYNFLDFYKGITKEPTKNKIETDFIQFNCKLISLRYGIPLDKIKLRYTDSYEDVEERMLFRTELYKEGWSIEQIEKYIYKYIYKDKYEMNIEKLKQYSVSYNNILSAIIEYKKEIQKKKGRPTLPLILKEYIKKKHFFKVRENMRKKYEAFNKYERIKENLLSKEEFDSLKEVIKDCNILEKLKNLSFNMSSL